MARQATEPGRPGRWSRAVRWWRPPVGRRRALRPGYVVHVPLVGLLFLSLLLLLAVLSLTSGNNLIYLLFSIMLSTGFVALLGSRWVLQGVEVTLRHPDRMMAGEEVALDLALENRRWVLPVVSLLLSALEVAPGEEREEVVDLLYVPLLPRRTELRGQVFRRFARRGVYHWRGVRLATRFPFGFLEHWRRMALGVGGHELVILPATRPLVGPGQSLPFDLGRKESRLKGRGSDLYLIRPLQQTDREQPIDWKATARTDQLMVRDFTREDDWRVTLLLDLEDQESEDRYERAIGLTASLLETLVAADAEVRLVTDGWASAFGRGATHEHALLDHLARLPRARPAAARRAERDSGERGEWLANSLSSDGAVLLIASAPRAVWPRARNLQLLELDELFPAQMAPRQPMSTAEGLEGKAVG